MEITKHGEQWFGDPNTSFVCPYVKVWYGPSEGDPMYVDMKSISRRFDPPNSGCPEIKRIGQKNVLHVPRNHQMLLTVGGYMIEYLTGYIAAVDVLARLAFFAAIILLSIKDRSLWSIVMLVGFLIYVVGSSEMWAIGSAISESKQAGNGYDAELNERYQTMIVITTFGFLLAGVSFLVRNIFWIFRDRRKAK